MQIPPVSSSLHPAPVHDLAALKRGNLNPEEQRSAVAGQFEAILLRQFLQESIGSMMGGGESGKSGGSGGGGGGFRYILTDKPGDKIFPRSGIGDAPFIAKKNSPPRGIFWSPHPQAQIP